MKRALVFACVLLAGCNRAQQDMYDQPRYKPFGESALFPDGAASRPLPSRSVVHSEGNFAGTTSGRAGEDAVRAEAGARGAQQMPFPVTRALLERGRERYTIYCSPCHSPVGDGDGLVTRHGFPHPPSYHTQRLREAPDRHFFDVMTNGYGIMYPYADRIAPTDRWAIVAYIRALQVSQSVEAQRLPPDVRSHLVQRTERPR